MGERRVPDRIEHRNGRVIIELDLSPSEAWDFVGMLPASDGFTREVARATAAADDWVQARADEPGLRIGVVMALSESTP